MKIPNLTTYPDGRKPIKEIYDSFSKFIENGWKLDIICKSSGNYMDKRISLPIIALSSDKETTRVVQAMRKELFDFVVKDEKAEKILRSAIQLAVINKRKSESNTAPIQIVTLLNFLSKHTKHTTRKLSKKIGSTICFFFM